MPNEAQAARELLRRRAARSNLGDYIAYVMPAYKRSNFSVAVCRALDQFVVDVQAGRRPILVLAAPPQHGKSEIVSRKLPAYLMGRFPNLRLAGASYGQDLANAMARDVRRMLLSQEHRRLFPAPIDRAKFNANRMDEFDSPGGTGSYLAVGCKGAITGRPVDIGIIDDPTKDAEQALSDTDKQAKWEWYLSVFLTRLSEHSGQIIMATQWAEDDLPGRIIAQYANDPRLRNLRFPALNYPDETGYNPELPQGALVPELKSEAFLREMKGVTSAYWWDAMYQQSASTKGGNVFKAEHVRYYLPSQLPEKFDKVIQSWDMTFKDTDGTDFVAGGIWGKRGSNSYLLDLVYKRLDFVRSARAVVAMKSKWPASRNILIEDKANGPAVISTLKGIVPGILPIEPDGSKLARGHAVSWIWEAGNVWLPSPEIAPWIKQHVDTLTKWRGEGSVAHDDFIDQLTQALRYLYPANGRLIISDDAINNAIFGGMAK